MSVGGSPPVDDGTGEASQQGCAGNSRGGGRGGDRAGKSGV